MKQVIIICLLITICSANVFSQLEVSKIDISKIRYKSTFIEEKTKDWQKIPVLFQLSDPLRKTEAICKSAVSTENIWFYLEVKDDIQFNDQIVANIYKGDCVQISIDARGDTTQGMPSDTRMVFGPDDNALGLALANGKQMGIVWTGQMNSTFENSDYTITRDEKKKITRYEVKLSWNKLKTVPFSNPDFGISVRVFDKDSLNDKGAELNFAKGVDGVPRTGLFEKVTYTNVPANYAAISGNQSVLWQNPGYLGFNAVVSCDGERVISASENGKQIAEKSLTSVAGSTIFYYIKYTPVQKQAITNLSLALKDKQNKVLSQQELSVVQPEPVLKSFRDLLDSISKSTTNELFIRHLNSVKSITLTEWARMLIYQKQNPKEASDVVQYVQRMYMGFKGDCGDWNSYLSGKRSLIMSFISRRDQTLQYYIFTLPAKWDIKSTYPMYVELHGAGNPNPLSGLGAYFSPANAKMDLYGYNDVRSYCQKRGLGYHIAPFGRGNSGYTDIGEIDVWEAIADVESKYLVDPDRRYLYGFSMGGGGTFLNAMYRPDYWAAIAIYSGTIRDSAPYLDNTLQHLAYLPKWVWCGEDDGLFTSFVKMKEWFKDQPGKTEFISSPGIGHSYLDEWQQKGVDWISQFTRKRPNEFTYTCIDSKHLSCWGISVVQDPKSECIPSFHFTIDGNKLILKTKNVTSLRIDTGLKGLQLTGNIEIFWNDKPAYSATDGEMVVLK